MATTRDLIVRCKEALDSCPHQKGTVRVMCQICMGRGESFGYDMSLCGFVLVPCPRCKNKRRNRVLEPCPCLESFDEVTICQAVHGDEGSYPELLEALNWDFRPSPDRNGVALKGSVAAEHLEMLREWASANKEITIPHPKAALLVHLCDCGLVEFWTLPEGQVVIRAKGAKEEFGRFLATVSEHYGYGFDQATICELLCFAYGVVGWNFQPRELRKYARGDDFTEFDSNGLDLVIEDGFLKGDEADLEEVIRRLYDSRDV
jgi:hypothetical protein